MKALWSRLAARFDALSLRERRLLALAMVGGVLLVGYAALIDPVAAANRTLRHSIERQAADLAALQSQLAGLEAQALADPDAGRKADIARQRAELQALAERLQASATALVPPERMNAVLESLLKRHPGLRLVSMKTLKPSGILGGRGAKGGEDAAQSAPAFDLYRHGVEIRLEGSYAEQYAYLAELERDQPGLLWGSVRLQVEEHPKNELTVVVYTLSSEKAWLAL